MTATEMPQFFVSALSLKVSASEVWPDGFKPAGPGYLVKADSAIEAVKVVAAYRAGRAWALDYDVEVVR
jgi:hypothetical protein